jgi:hypothetical protein
MIPVTSKEAGKKIQSKNNIKTFRISEGFFYALHFPKVLIFDVND